MKAKGNRILGTLGAGLAAAALLAGGVQAAERPDDRAGMLGVGGAQVVVAPDAFERAVARATAADPAPPDAFERAVARALAADAVVRPDDRAGVRGPGIVPTAASPTVTSDGDGFAWGDALFGAAAMFGIVLLGAVGALAIRRRGLAVR